jgi:hypothetical protein
VKISFSTIAFILSIYPALAEPLPTFDTSGGQKYTGDMAPLSRQVKEQIRDANEHELQTWEETRDAGGCNAAVIPYSIAAHCWNYSTNNYPLDSGIGSKGGSD